MADMQEIEKKLWEAADKMRNNMDPAEYKHVVLGLIFLKYISDRFEAQYQMIKNDNGDVEDKDEYTAEGVFFVPEKARWENIKKASPLPSIGEIIDGAMLSIEKENSQLQGVLEKRYSREELDKTKLGELINIITDIETYTKTKTEELDLIGRIYEYFLGRFASSEGKGGGEFYTPSSIVKTLVEMIEPYKGRVYDPCCGSGGMFVQSEEFVKNHQGRIEDISIYGQESNSTTWKLAKMNLAIRGIEGNLGQSYADTFLNDQHKRLDADFVLANPPFNISDWGQENIKDDDRWLYGVPPKGNANYGWLQHILSKLSHNGVAGVVLANGSLSTSTNEELIIRKGMLEADKIDAIVALPEKLFYTTGIPVSLWILNNNKSTNSNYRSRKNEVLFIDARNLGQMIDRKTRELTQEDVSKIASVYHEWRTKDGDYIDIAGFVKSETLEEIEKNNYVLTPGRYVGIEEVEDDGISFEEKMTELTKTLSGQFKKSRELEEEIKKQLASIGFEMEVE